VNQEIPSVHHGHHEIENDQARGLLGVPCQPRKRLSRVPRSADVVTATVFQGFADDLSDNVSVLFICDSLSLVRRPANLRRIAPRFQLAKRA